jgi:hypothetical protein
MSGAGAPRHHRIFHETGGLVVPRKRILDIVRPHVVSVPASDGLVGLGALEMELELELELELEPEPEPEAFAHPSPMRAGLPAGGDERWKRGNQEPGAMILGFPLFRKSGHDRRQSHGGETGRLEG